jgi:hypothetical protein
MASSILYKPFKKRLHRRLGWDGTRLQALWQVFFTMNLVVLSFVLFRAGTLAHAAEFYGGLCRGWMSPDFGFLTRCWQDPLDPWVLGLGLAAAALVESARRRAGLDAPPAWLRWSAYVTLLACILLFGRFYTQKQFIYAQF